MSITLNFVRIFLVLWWALILVFNYRSIFSFPHSPPALSKYRQKAKDLMAQARQESSREKDGGASSSSSSGSPSPEKEPAAVVIRQRSMTPRSRNNRLSYIDNEIRFLDGEQQEIDRQAAILDKRLR